MHIDEKAMIEAGIVIEYDNDTGPDDGGFWEWWTVVENGDPVGKFDSEVQAKRVAALIYESAKPKEAEEQPVQKMHTFAASPPAVPGMPEEEEIARAICVGNPDDCVFGTAGTHEPSVCHRRRWQDHLGQARAILSLIRPAFEAKERELSEALDKLADPSRDWAWHRGAKDAFNAFQKLQERALSAEAKLAQAVEARETDAIELDDWAYKWLISLRPETDERETYKDGYFYGALHVLGKVRDRARMIADVDAVSIRREAASAAARGETR